MVADIERFQQLVEDLLEISRFDAGVMHLDLEEVRVAELVMQAVQMSTDVDVPVDIDSDLAGVVVKADKRRLSRVIANLLDNAAKYGDGATRVELRKRGDAVLIAVEDDGPGRARRGPGGDLRPLQPRQLGAGTGAASTASASAWRSWPSTSGCTAARCGSRTGPTGSAAPASSSSCPRRRREPIPQPPALRGRAARSRPCSSAGLVGGLRHPRRRRAP